LLSHNTPPAVTEAVKLLHQRNIPSTEALLPTLKSLTKQTLSLPLEQENASLLSLLRLLRDTLYRLTVQLKPGSDGDTAKNDLYELLMATHYHHMLHQCLYLGLKEVAAKDYDTEKQAPKGMEWRNWEGDKLNQIED
jgi:hypothetical protein